MHSNKKITWAASMLLSILFCFSLSGLAQEKVNINAILPEGAIAEITNAYPDFKVTVVPKKKDANTSVKYRNAFLRVDGVESQETRERMAKYVLQYLENPNKRVEDRKRREDYEALPPKEKLANLKERIIDRHPNFTYEWVRYEKANVKARLGERGLLISGVENPGAMEEWANAIVQIHKEINKERKGKGRMYEDELRELEMVIGELRIELAEARLHMAELRRERMRKEMGEGRQEQDMPPLKLREQFIQRIKLRYPNFSYKWVGLGQGNTEAIYGDNAILIKGIEEMEVRHEIGMKLISIQKQIDKQGQGEEGRKK